MNELIGQVITALVTDENETAFFVQKDGVIFELKKETLEQELTIGETVTGFAYENSSRELILSTFIPKSRVGHYAFGEVVETRRDLGVFVNIGLPDKDIVVSLDILPTITKLWPKPGDRLMIAIEVDQKGRMWGQLADESIFRSISKGAKPEMKNQDVMGTVYRLKLAGTFILTDDFYIGFIHPSEREAEPRLGQQVKGRVIGVRPEGSLNVSLKPRAYEEIGDDAEMIMAVLKRQPDYAMPYTDRSDPEAIKSYFGISKGSFKRALGRLMKNGLITQAEGLTSLTEKGQADIAPITDDEKQD
ncbi:CvfB family protein [Latilactobacillus curvatus]|uniref:CvfB family protein n=1 Tax=Latilactobacillus curvatus TaxID=28038 RepID=UPI000DBAE8EA|nr:S1-like domain-containing RNA-binding protein [Latilactobacillus curvatus]MDT7016760.1 S1-like domain-containing RNA-binding protein [Latilactobacillus curvatus]BBE26312.1 S1 RNA-binding protein [Latilactobacillus curvatus]